MRRKQRRIALIVGSTAVLAAVALAALWFFRTPLLQLVPTPPIVITEKDQGRVVNLIPGEHLEVRLPSNSYAGSTWHVGIPLTFLPQTGDVTFTGSPNPAKPGDGYQSTQFTATGTGFGPLFLDYLPDNDQNSYTPSRAFSVIVSVQ